MDPVDGHRYRCCCRSGTSERRRRSLRLLPTDVEPSHKLNNIDAAVLSRHRAKELLDDRTTDRVPLAYGGIVCGRADERLHHHLPHTHTVKRHISAKGSVKR